LSYDIFVDFDNTIPSGFLECIGAEATIDKIEVKFSYCPSCETTTTDAGASYNFTSAPFTITDGALHTFICLRFLNGTPQTEKARCSLNGDSFYAESYDRIHNGTIVITGGTISGYGTNAYNNPMQWNGSFTVANGMNLGTGSVTLGANMTITVDDSVTVGGVISGAYNLTKAGVGTLTLSGNNTATGNLTASAGGDMTLSGTNAWAGVYAQAGAGLTIAGSTSVSTTVHIAGYAVVYPFSGSAILYGNGNIYGNLALSGISTFTGTVGGTLTLAGGTWQGSGTVSGLVTTYGGRVTGILTASSGVVVNTYELLSGGTIIGNVEVLGTASPATTGAIFVGYKSYSPSLEYYQNLTITGDLEFQSLSYYRNTISSTTIAGYKVVVSGDLFIASNVTLEFDDINSDVLQLTETFEIITADSITGTFFDGLPDGAYTTAGLNKYRIAYTSTKITLEVVSDFTVTIASPAVLTTPNATGLFSGPPNDATIDFTTTGALPSPLVVGTTYYVVNILSPTTFQISTSNGGAAITTTGTQSGTHTLRYVP